MTEPMINKEMESRRTGGRLGRILLWLWICLVVLGILVITLLSSFEDVLADTQWPQLESGYVNVLIYALVLISSIGGLLWILFFSGGRWYSRLIRCVLILACAASPLIYFQPIFGGGLSV